jgi:hypothetical protein
MDASHAKSKSILERLKFFTNRKNLQTESKQGTSKGIFQDASQGWK